MSYSDGGYGGSHAQDVFCGQLGFGVSYDVTENIAVDLSYRHVWTGDEHAIKGVADTDRNYDNQIFLGARYTF